MDTEINSRICKASSSCLPVTFSHLVVSTQDTDSHRGQGPQQRHPSNLVVWFGELCHPFGFLGANQEMDGWMDGWCVCVCVVCL